MWPKQGHLISKQLSDAQKYKIRFVGQLGVREAAAVRSAKTWKGGERKTGKKKEKKRERPCTNASFHLEVE